MKILVIGNEGFIAGHMIPRLREEGHDVVGLDVMANDNSENGYFAHRGDILIEEDVLKAARGCDMVINLAAKHHDFGILREEFFLINGQGTKNCLSCLSKLGIKKFLFCSTVAVYGERDEESHERMTLKPSNDYGESKKAGEDIVRQWADEDASREILIIRPVVVFGPHNYANMFRLIDNIYLNRFLMVGKGGNIKAVAYVENLVEAMLFMIKKMSSGVETINYSDQPHKISSEITNVIRQKLGRKPVRFRVPLGLAVCLAYPFDILARIVNFNFPITAKRIKKFNAPTVHGSQKVRDLGFKQKVTTEEGLGRMVQWYLKDGYQNRFRCAAGSVQNDKIGEKQR
ncbi:MAG: NAD(P)-dependent oxidoreductase [Candidatus Omnitrophica bacterium]|nr:NAD(P)-dependent oxidoreductase [Candidatus Omnitrophota bacterium]